MRSSTEWLLHFETNRRALIPIPWDDADRFSPVELKALGRSLAEFQRGESSEGRHLIRYAEVYARRSGDLAYPKAIRLFIAEEQRHARDLARFLELNGVPLMAATFSDAIFRRLRNVLGTLEVSIAVLILAELIAQVYYDAVRRATRLPILTRLCEQILRDEADHVRFQAEQLGRLRAERSPVGWRMTMAAQRLLFATTCAVVWIVHRPALRLGGYTLDLFWTAAWARFDAAFLLSSRAAVLTHGRRVRDSSARRRISTFSTIWPRICCWVARSMARPRSSPDT